MRMSIIGQLNNTDSKNITLSGIGIGLMKGGFCIQTLLYRKYYIYIYETLWFCRTKFAVYPLNYNIHVYV